MAWKRVYKHGPRPKGQGADSTPSLGPDDVTPAENRAMIEAQDGAVSPKAHRSKAKMPRKRITLDDCLAGCEKLKPLRGAEDYSRVIEVKPPIDFLPDPSETHRERWTRKLTESRERNRVRKLEVDTDTALKKRAKAILEDSDD